MTGGREHALPSSLIHAVGGCEMRDESVELMLLDFFSSKRRHTRYWRDWSSDVCSSDLSARPAPASPPGPRSSPAGRTSTTAWSPTGGRGAPCAPPRRRRPCWPATSTPTATAQIGRASCREKSVDLGGRRIIKKNRQSSL